jgi:hypothetical protein
MNHQKGNHIGTHSATHNGNHTHTHKSHEAERKTVMQGREYIGAYTAINLDYVERGVITLAHVLAKKHIHDMVSHDPNHVFCADYAISLQETLSILQKQHGIEKTPRALIATIREYQCAIKDIERDPTRYTTEVLTPERVRSWYEQEIQNIREQLRESIQS